MTASVNRPARRSWLCRLAVLLLAFSSFDSRSQSTQPPALKPPRSPGQYFDQGMAWAKAGHWTEAERAFEKGERLAPRDVRFPEELAGVAFKQKKNALAERRLRAALRLAPKDDYALDFLATLYFLDGNYTAALKYWNRESKPQIANISSDPLPQVSPALLDHAFAFSPAGALLLPQYLSTKARLNALGIFPAFQLNLDARADGRFNAALRAHELDGFGGAGWGDLAYLLQGLPFAAVEPSYWNIRKQAINFNSMLRWDDEKRRAFAQLSGPWEGSAKYRWEWLTDLRNENWALRDESSGPAPVLASFNMRTERGGFNLASYASGRIGWSVGAELSNRNFRSVEPGTVLTPHMIASGIELKQREQLTGVLWRVPEHRFVLSAGTQFEAARLWSNPAQNIEKLTGSLLWRWFPREQGDDYAMTQQLRSGKIFGRAPIDELYILGLERDNDLPMIAHIGTRDGLKGSAPLGRDYLLQNWEMDKDIYGNGLLKIQIGPVLDIGKITDPGTALGSHQWMFDTGAALKLRVLGVGMVFTYGRGQRSGVNALYAEGLD
ncbi:MAG: tetratricopeptide repeat protein [Acidobacteriota bacterium]